MARKKKTEVEIAILKINEVFDGVIPEKDKDLFNGLLKMLVLSAKLEQIKERM